MAPALFSVYKPMYMKNKRVLLLAGSIFLSVLASAQLKPGIKAGIHHGGLSGYGDGKRLSFHAGLFLAGSTTKKFRMLPELVWQQVLQDYRTDNNETTVVNTLSVSMVTLPLLFRYYPAKQFYLEAGPQFSVITGAKDQSAGGTKADVRRNLSNTQFAWQAGLGMDITRQFSCYLRYQAGFSDITLYDSGKDLVRLLQAGIAYRLK